MMLKQICVASYLGVTLVMGTQVAVAKPPVMVIQQAMEPPHWALMQRELLRANVAACQEFYDRYFDERGYLECVERWGGDDGPDDAIENLLYWPILHAAGADDSILKMYKHAWEGHLRQYTAAKTVEVPFARDGMYYKEFPVMFDWLHHSEGLTVFNLQGLSDPYDHLFQKRVRRYAGFYMNEDPQADNYDPQHKIIRSLLNGSRGPMLRKATGLDWAGDPIEVEHRFDLGHGEENYEQMVAHFKDYNDVVGDHPSNLLATCLALNGYMLNHEPKYKDWILEYVGAWRQRMVDNSDLIPTNVGLDGTLGGGADGKWYGGVYGWGFTVVVPQTGALANRQTFHLGVNGFLNAVLLTGDRGWMTPWRKQMERVNSNKRVENGKTVYPHKYGDDGWYAYQPNPYSAGAKEIYYVTMADADRKLLASDGWVRYVNGENPDYPLQVLNRDFNRLKTRVAGLRADTTTPDTRLADDPMRFNPAAVQSLVELMMGGIYPSNNGLILHTRLRYFDVARRRAGIPEDVAALVERLSDDQAEVTLVNINPSEGRTLMMQAGTYGEHQFVTVDTGNESIEVNGAQLMVRLAPGAGQRLRLKMQRYVNQPTLSLPWSPHELP